jgi:hypothetical protein
MPRFSIHLRQRHQSGWFTGSRISKPSDDNCAHSQAVDR